MGWLQLPVRSRPHPSALFILDPDGGLFRPHLSTSSIPQWGTVHTPPQASSGRLSAHHDARTEERVVQLGEVPKRRNEAGRSYETPLLAFSWGAPVGAGGVLPAQACSPLPVRLCVAPVQGGAGRASHPAHASLLPLPCSLGPAHLGQIS